MAITARIRRDSPSPWAERHATIRELEIAAGKLRAELAGIPEEQEARRRSLEVSLELTLGKIRYHRVAPL